MTYVNLMSNQLVVFEEGVFKEMLQQMVSVQPSIGYVDVSDSILFNTLVTNITKLAFSNWNQIGSPAVATSPGSFETIVTSFRQFEMESAPTTARFHPSFSRNWTPIPLPSVRETERSQRRFRPCPLDAHRHIYLERKQIMVVEFYNLETSSGHHLFIF